MPLYRAAARVNPDRTAAQNNPEFWFRTAENALYFRPGDPQPPPDAPNPAKRTRGSRSTQ